MAKTSAREMFTDMFLIAGADYIIGTCTSTVSEVASELYIARMMTRTKTTDPGGAWHKPLRVDGERCKSHHSELYADEWSLL